MKPLGLLRLGTVLLVNLSVFFFLILESQIAFQLTHHLYIFITSNCYFKLIPLASLIYLSYNLSFSYESCFQLAPRVEFLMYY